MTSEADAKLLLKLAADVDALQRRLNGIEAQLRSHGFSLDYFADVMDVIRERLMDDDQPEEVTVQ